MKKNKLNLRCVQPLINQDLEQMRQKVMDDWMSQVTVCIDRVVTDYHIRSDQQDRWEDSEYESWIHQWNQYGEALAVAVWDQLEAQGWVNLQLEGRYGGNTQQWLTQQYDGWKHILSNRVSKGLPHKNLSALGSKVQVPQRWRMDPFCIKGCGWFERLSKENQNWYEQNIVQWSQASVFVQSAYEIIYTDEERCIRSGSAFEKLIDMGKEQLWCHSASYRKARSIQWIKDLVYQQMDITVAGQLQWGALQYEVAHTDAGEKEPKPWRQFHTVDLFAHKALQVGMLGKRYLAHWESLLMSDQMGIKNMDLNNQTQALNSKGLCQEQKQERSEVKAKKRL